MESNHSQRKTNVFLQKESFYFFVELPTLAIPDDCVLDRKKLDLDQVRRMMHERRIDVCLTDSDKSFVDFVRSKHGIEIEIPHKVPNFQLGYGDELLVMDDTYSEGVVFWHYRIYSRDILPL